MRNRGKPRRGLSRSKRTIRVLAVAMTLALVAATHPWAVLAQDVLNCSVNGLCVSQNLTNLLGLPNGTLNIRTYKPWDRVVKGSASVAWAPLEAEARAMLAALHGVPNDFRLPHAALNDLRAAIFMRLMALAKQKAQGTTPLTSVEQDALDTFSRLIVQRRVRAAQKALDQYAGWKGNPCGYTVPGGFGFEQYEPGPLCGVGGVMLAGPPRPPTKEQFTAYGAALAMKEDEALIKEAKRAALGVSAADPTFTYDTSADVEAALRNTDQALAIGAGVAGAILVGTVATIAASASLAVAGTFAAIAGSFSIFGTTASTVAVGAFASAGAIGVGVAASLPALVILSAVVAVVYIIQFAEDQSVLPMLQESLENSRHPADIWALAASDDPYNRLELFATFINQTLPSYDEERAQSVVPPPPTQRGLGDPQVEVNGEVRDAFETFTADSKLQQTFMSQGWFVTRIRTQVSPEMWGPWRWSLTVRYRGAALTDTGTHIVGIQPTGFFHTYQSSTLAVAAARRVTEFQSLGPSLQTQTVKWSGNRAPILAPTVSEQPQIASPVTFTAGASDPDISDSIRAIRWYFEDPTINPLKPSFAECSLTPPGQIDGATGLPFTCPWAARDDAGAGVSYTFALPGTWTVLVQAQDSQGAVSSQQFTVTIGNVAPTLVVTRLPFLVLPPAVPSTQEGDKVAVAGTVNYPGLPDGSYGALTSVVVDWGDGQVSSRMYPCRAPGFSSPSDRGCLILVGGGAIVFAPPPGDPPLTPGPWSFEFDHVYAYGGGEGAFVNPAQVKVYAVTTLGAWSQVERVSFNITNVASVFEVRPTCPVVPARGPLGEIVLCVAGDYREVAVGQPLTINGRISDVPQAEHFVKVLWGDTTSSAHPPGCTAAGCPGTLPPWMNAAPSPTSYTPDYFNVSHTYDSVGTYPVTLVVDDSGPDGPLSYSTQAVIFGVSQLSGPTEVHSGSPSTYTYMTVLPAGATPTITPTCEGGQVTSETTSSFTCTFDGVGAKTARKVALQAVIAGTTFDRSLAVDVLSAPTTISALGGATSVGAGTTSTYTYTETHAPGGIVFVIPSCGSYGSVVASATGSITCRFHDVDTEVTTDVGITISATGGAASSSLTVTVVPDTTPPVLTLPESVQVNSTSNAGATANFAVTAIDAVSGPSALVICSAFTGQLFPIGTTMVTCSAADWTGNVANGSFPVAVKDVTPPSLSLPAAQTLAATGPGGAVATFAATAADAIPAAPLVSCVPPSESTFAVGTTTVNCSATDAAGNSASGSFAITVDGALPQITALQTYVNGLPVDPVIKRALVAALRVVATTVSAGRPGACGQLTAVSIAANLAERKLTAAQLERLLSDVARIRAVLGC